MRIGCYRVNATISAFIQTVTETLLPTLCQTSFFVLFFWFVVSNSRTALRSLVRGYSVSFGKRLHRSYMFTPVYLTFRDGEKVNAFTQV